jgi:putative restriction endonuclease
MARQRQVDIGARTATEYFKLLYSKILFLLYYSVNQTHPNKNRTYPMKKSNNIASQIVNIKTWKRGNQRAPHKPLLLLMALAAVQRGEDRLKSFEEIEKKLKELLIEFGTPAVSHHPEYPFWRLQNDGDFWEIPQKSLLLSMAGTKSTNIDITTNQFRSTHAQGGFSSEVYKYLKDNSESRRKADQPTG